MATAAAAAGKEPGLLRRRSVSLRVQKKRSSNIVLKLSAIITKVLKKKRRSRSRSCNVSLSHGSVGGSFLVHPPLPKSAAFVCDDKATWRLSALAAKKDARVLRMLNKKHLFTTGWVHPLLLQQGWQRWTVPGRIVDWDALVDLVEQEVLGGKKMCKKALDTLDTYVTVCRGCYHPNAAPNFTFFLTGDGKFFKRYISDHDRFYKLATVVSRSSDDWVTQLAFPITNAWDVSTGTLDPMSQMVTISRVVTSPFSYMGPVGPNDNCLAPDEELLDCFVCDVFAYEKLRGNEGDSKTSRFMAGKLRAGFMWLSTCMEHGELAPGWRLWPSCKVEQGVGFDKQSISLEAFKEACKPLRLPGLSTCPLPLEHVIFVTGNREFFQLLVQASRSPGDLLGVEKPRLFRAWDVSGDQPSDVLTFLEDPSERLPENLSVGIV